MTTLRSPFGGGFDRPDAEALAHTLKALSDPQRLLIVSLLHHNGPMGPVRLQGHLGLAQPTVSYHLRALDGVGLTRWGQDGPSCPRTLEPGAFTALARLLAANR